MELLLVISYALVGKERNYSKKKHLLRFANETIRTQFISVHSNKTWALRPTEGNNITRGQQRPVFAY